MTDTDRPLEDKVALVTGASRGIGFAVAQALAATGAHVIAIGRTKGALEELDDAIKSDGGTATLAPFDLSELDRIDDLVGSIYQRFKRLDILIANAGQLGALSPMAHANPKDWQTVFQVNVFASQRLIRSCDALLRDSGSGRAVFTTCAAARNRKAFWSAYAASKSALETLVLTWAAEVSKTSLRVNLVDPGAVATRLRAAAYPGEEQSTLPQPADVARLFVDAASPGETRHGEIISALQE